MSASALFTSAPVAPRFISVGRRCAARKVSLAVRASQENSTEANPSSQSATYFYRGESYTPQQWEEANRTGAVNAPIPQESYIGRDVDTEVIGLGELMAFSGPLPELVNGRLAMLAFVAALAAELASGESVLKQWASEPTGVILTFITFTTASLFPMLENGTKREAFGPFTPNAEMLNGRAAMIGFASLLAVEAFRGGAAFFG